MEDKNSTCKTSATVFSYEGLIDWLLGLEIVKKNFINVFIVNKIISNLSTDNCPNAKELLTKNAIVTERINTFFASLTQEEQEELVARLNEKSHEKNSKIKSKAQSRTRTKAKSQKK